VIPIIEKNRKYCRNVVIFYEKYYNTPLIFIPILLFIFKKNQKNNNKNKNMNKYKNKL
jgi:hypothetical protein